MPTIEEQIILEERMLARGAEQYQRYQEEARKNGRGAETNSSRRIIAEFLEPLVEELNHWLHGSGPGVHGAARVALRAANPWHAVYITLKELMNSFTFAEPVVQTAGRIGRMIEDEIRFTRFKRLHEGYYHSIIEDFKRKKVQSEAHKHRVMTHTANTIGDQWEEWNLHKRVLVGTRLLDLVLVHTDLAEKRLTGGKKGYITSILPTQQCEDWIKASEDAAALLHPEKLPTVVPPMDWTSLTDGGYFTPEMRRNTPMVKCSSKRQRRILEQADLRLPMQSLNTMQRTPWAVNTRVLDVAREVWAKNLGVGMPASDKLTPDPCPLPKELSKHDMTPEQRAIFEEWKREASEVYTLEKERIGKSFQIARLLRVAGEYREYNRFWFVWYMDFRGRAYTATAGFSVQGPDLAKGLLQFADGKPLTPVGWNWFRIHGANTYGFDKATFSERIAWVEERRELFLRVANDPLSNREVWGNADKPYQFLAWCFEFADACNSAKLTGRPEHEYVSRLALGQDGSCNGLQNFSAMLRDSVGGRATNLVPAERPADIYSEVAAVCTRKVHALAAGGDEQAREWVNFWNRYSEGKMARSTAKRPVMTLPYGSTRNSCTHYIYLDVIATDRKFFEANFKAAVWMTPYLWDSINEVVKSARTAMDWLQKSCSVMGKIDKPCIWTCPDGFVVMQISRQIETTKIETKLQGTFCIRVGERTDKMDKRKNRNSISPNFVHSMDASHMRSTVRIAEKLGVTHFALIHDDYGTHACDVPALHKAIRESFVNMYTKYDPLQVFYDNQVANGGKLPAVPGKGTLDIDQVRVSPYFFS